MTDTNVMKDLSEIIQYDRAGIPLYINTARLSTYPDGRALCHWHDDIEWIHILEGTMNYKINGRKLTLQKSDSLMINTRQMHYGYTCGTNDCLFICILFHPDLLTENRLISDAFLKPILENRNLEYLLFSNGQSSAAEIAQLLKQITHLKKEAAFGCELEIIGLLHQLWARLLNHNEAACSVHPEEFPGELQLQKDMVSFIYQHYMEKLTLNDIASAGNVCRSKCCSVFRHYLGQSPIDFLNTCRLKISCELLKTSDDSITRIALTCGFNHPSYYTRLFSRIYGCTPKEYRKLYRNF